MARQGVACPPAACIPAWHTPSLPPRAHTRAAPPVAAAAVRRPRRSSQVRAGHARSALASASAPSPAALLLPRRKRPPPAVRAALAALTDGVRAAYGFPPASAYAARAASAASAAADARRGDLGGRRDGRGVARGHGLAAADMAGGVAGAVEDRRCAAAGGAGCERAARLRSWLQQPTRQQAARAASQAQQRQWRRRVQQRRRLLEIEIERSGQPPRWASPAVAPWAAALAAQQAAPRIVLWQPWRRGRLLDLRAGTERALVTALCAAGLRPTILRPQPHGAITVAGGARGRAGAYSGGAAAAAGGAARELSAELPPLHAQAAALSTASALLGAHSPGLAALLWLPAGATVVEVTLRLGYCATSLPPAARGEFGAPSAGPCAPYPGGSYASLAQLHGVRWMSVDAAALAPAHAAFGDPLDVPRVYVESKEVAALMAVVAGEAESAAARGRKWSGEPFALRPGRLLLRPGAEGHAAHGGQAVAGAGVAAAGSRGAEAQQPRDREGASGGAAELLLPWTVGLPAARAPRALPSTARRAGSAGGAWLRSNGEADLRLGGGSAGWHDTDLQAAAAEEAPPHPPADGDGVAVLTAEVPGRAV